MSEDQNNWQYLRFRIKHGIGSSDYAKLNMKKLHVITYIHAHNIPK